MENVTENLPHETDHKFIVSLSQCVQINEDKTAAPSISDCVVRKIIFSYSLYKHHVCAVR